MAEKKTVRITLPGEHLAELASLDKQLAASSQGQPVASLPEDPAAYNGHVEVQPDVTPPAQVSINATPEAAAALHDALQKFVDSDASFAMVKHAGVPPSGTQSNAPGGSQSDENK